MSDADVSVDGEIDSQLPRTDLARLLAGAGLATEDSAYALRLRLAGERVEFTRDDVGYILCSGFDTPESRSQLPEFSAALGRLDLRHRFEIYEGNDLVDYLHHAWELDEDNDGGDE
ncbi:MAG: hypothetical protein Q8M31_05210 [Beijerinckiaceae bacterium]|nr:hypothetical protein [Beijerinckiaceae bacterium]